MEIRKILECSNIFKIKSTDILIAKNHGLSVKVCPKTPANKPRMTAILYANAIGSIMYAIMYT